MAARCFNLGIYCGTEKSADEDDKAIRLDPSKDRLGDPEVYTDKHIMETIRKLQESPSFLFFPFLARFGVWSETRMPTGL